MYDTFENQSNVVYTKEVGAKLSYAKVFLFFGLALLITAAVTIGVSSLLYYLVRFNPDTYYTASIVLMCVGGIGIFVLPFIINIKAFKEGHSLVVPFVLYSICMGLLLSGVVFAIDNPYVIGIAFLITALMFLFLAGVGFFIGDKIGIFWTILIGLMFAYFIMAMVNLFLLPFLFFGSESTYTYFSTFYWIVEAVFILILMIYVIIDINRLKKVINSGIVIHTNLALYFATSLYTDFIYLFIRILYIVLYFVGRRD